MLHAIRQLPVLAPPADFARLIAAYLQDYADNALAEQWLLRIAAMAALLLGVACLRYAAPARGRPMVMAGGLAGFAR